MAKEIWTSDDNWHEGILILEVDGNAWVYLHPDLGHGAYDGGHEDLAHSLRSNGWQKSSFLEIVLTGEWPEDAGKWKD